MRADLERFLASVQARALRTAELSLRDREDAMDAVQDSMLKFVQNYANKPQAEWAPLFFRILYNRITDFQRKGTVRRGIFSSLFSRTDSDEAQLDQQIYMADSAPVDPQRLSDADKFAVRLEAALKALPERQRQAFLLREWEGLDVRSTATAMQCSEGSVKTHLSRAKKSLQEKLGDF